MKYKQYKHELNFYAANNKSSPPLRVEREQFDREEIALGKKARLGYIMTLLRNAKMLNLNFSGIDELMKKPYKMSEKQIAYLEDLVNGRMG